MNATNSPQSPAQGTASAPLAVRDYLAERVALLASHKMADEVTISAVRLLHEHGLLGFYSAAYYRAECNGLSLAEASMMYAEYQASHDQRLKHRKQLLDLLGTGRDKLTYWVDEIPAGQPFKNRQHAEQIVFKDQCETMVSVRIAQNQEEGRPFTITPGITGHKRQQIHSLTPESETCSTAEQVRDKVHAIMAKAAESYR